MPWDDAARLEADLNRALDAFDWQSADNICEEIVRRVLAERALLPEPSARRLMRSLRRKSRFRSMTLLGAALLQSGLSTPEVRRQYSQGLIDQGMFYPAEQELKAIIDEPQGVAREVAEARGLLGRIYKQLYVNNREAGSTPNAAHLQRALKEYLTGYQLNPWENYWHGINVVALTVMARRDGVPLADLPDAEKLAKEIVATLDQREQSGLHVYAFDEATRMEAYVALGRHQETLDTALRYLDATGTDAFELQSTIRQLRQVWRLTEDAPPGDRLLPLLSAEHLAKVGGGIDLDAKRVVREMAAAEKAAADPQFQAILGDTRMATFRWYRKGLAQCSSVARIEQRDGTGYGTGWLVRAGDFFPGCEGVLLLTNNHVISDPVNPYSILPGDAQVNFQALGEIYDVERIVWQAPYGELDATFLQLKGDGVPKAPPLLLHDRAPEVAVPPPRMYIIGHPDGRDLEISLQDNFLIACNQHLIHYRTPTEHGSSGSPVFEPLDWRVTALHHKGGKKMQRLDAPGTYAANEGISILALQEATRRTSPAAPERPPGGTPREVRPPA